jgi:hypothetical protein
MGLLSFLFGSKQPQPQQPQTQPAGGLLSVPKGTDQQAYKDYAEQCMMKGQQPMSFADYMKSKQPAQQK